MRCASTLRSSDRCSMRAMRIRDIDVPPDMQPSSTGFLRMLGNDNNRNHNNNKGAKKRACLCQCRSWFGDRTVRFSPTLGVAPSRLTNRHAQSEWCSGKRGKRVGGNSNKDATHLSRTLSVSPSLPGPATIRYWKSANIPLNHGIHRGISTSCESMLDAR